MYSVKLVRANGDVEYFDCAHVSIKTVTPDCLAARDGLASPGHYFELSTGKEVSLPADGKSVFLVNSGGVTVDAYHWPIRPKVAATARKV